MGKDQEITVQIYNDIKAERCYQDLKWGGAEHDDFHNHRDWVTFIVQYLGRAAAPEDFRTSMIKVAALAVAAIEWYDRLGKEL